MVFREEIINKNIIGYIHNILGAYDLEAIKDNQVVGGTKVKTYKLLVPIRDYSVCNEFFSEIGGYLNLIKKDNFSDIIILSPKISFEASNWYIKLMKSINGESYEFYGVYFYETDKDYVIEENDDLIDNILKGMYDSVKNNVSSDLYAFKGGFVLSNMVNGLSEVRGTRRTKDIDISTVNKDSFYKILKPIIEFLADLKEKGEIGGFDYEEPVYEDGRKRSGKISVYKLGVPDGKKSRKKYELCNVDISYHTLNFGIITVSGASVYSPERMLADKICVMFTSIDIVDRRARDILDIYLINLCNKINTGKEYILNDLLVNSILYRVNESCIDFYKESALSMYASSDYSSLLASLKSVINDGKVNRDFFRFNNAEDILAWVIKYIGIVKSNIIERV